MEVNADDILKTYHQHVAEVNQNELNKNREIAVDFCEKFTDYVSENYDLPMTVKTQGSSFEGLKVRSADEFDFLVVFLTRDSPDGFIPVYNDPTPANHNLKIEMEEYKQQAGKLKCYHPILMNGLESSNQVYGEMRGTWYGKKAGGLGHSGYSLRCLSATNSIAVFKRLLTEYKEAIDDGDVEMPDGVADVEIIKDKVSSPNFKIKLEKDDAAGRKINLDISPAIRFKDPDSERYEYYIAKKTPKIGRISRPDHLQLLWFACFSQEERIVIDNKTDIERDNYCIVKSLLGEYLPNAYTLKTLFMLADNKLPKEPLAFLHEMIVSFHGALYAEMKYRGYDVPFVVGEGDEVPINRLLISKFNRCENVLAKFSYNEIRNWFDEFDKFRNNLDANNLDVFFRYVLGIQEYKRLKALAEE